MQTTDHCKFGQTSLSNSVITDKFSIHGTAAACNNRNFREFIPDSDVLPTIRNITPYIPSKERIAGSGGELFTIRGSGYIDGITRVYVGTPYRRAHKVKVDADGRSLTFFSPSIRRDINEGEDMTYAYSMIIHVTNIQDDIEGKTHSLDNKKYTIYHNWNDQAQEIILKYINDHDIDNGVEQEQEEDEDVQLIQEPEKEKEETDSNIISSTKKTKLTETNQEEHSIQHSTVITINYTSTLKTTTTNNSTSSEMDDDDKTVIDGEESNHAFDVDEDINDLNEKQNNKKRKRYDGADEEIADILVGFHDQSLVREYFNKASQYSPSNIIILDD